MTPAALAALMSGDRENFLAATTPGGIEAQEKCGQDTLVNNSSLPKDAPWETLQALGVTKGSEVHDLFVDCVLPQGWKKVATDHAMWSDLVDDKGNKVASIFYKTAFYDRSAFLRLASK